MSKTTDTKQTPLMKQYNAIKAKYPGALLLFRVGDFYETFGDDAITASKILDIVLTKRANGAASHIELAGFPHHSLDAYLPKLVRAGQRVAICDQLEDPKSVKGIVKRGVTELVTPGLSMNDNVLEGRKNNFLGAIHCEKEQFGVALLDLSTGEFYVATGTREYVFKLLQSFQVAEVVYERNAREKVGDSFLDDQFSTFVLEDWVFQYDYAYEKLIAHFNTKTLKGFGIEEQRSAIVAAGAVMHYLEATEHREIDHIRSISRLEEERFMWLDRFTVRNLELIHSTQADGVSLLNILDQTVTPMGGRTLRKWLVLPLKELPAIELRHNLVEALAEIDLEVLRKELKQIGDLERLISKIAAGRINPRELAQLRRGLGHIEPIKILLKSSSKAALKTFEETLQSCASLIEYLETHLQDEPPLNLAQGNVIREGINEQLDEYRSLAFSGKDYLLQIQKREIEATAIPSLKIAYNKVFGYYLEVTNAHKDKVPETWIRKQTLVNAERYITPELKEYEEKILKAEAEISTIENRLFQQVVSHTQQFIGLIQQNAGGLGSLDVYATFSELAKIHKYVRPSLSAEHILDIKQGRHPVIETLMPADEEYVPNDVFLDQESQQIIIITGPNMAGKSALLRQTALIVIMAQIGSFVPAGYAKIGLVDKIFTRVGASDNLSRGESTFMVEMTETASILNNLSDRSLVIMDEIGRGTSTYDGISIAWSIVEYLHNHPKHKAKTLFATHYHELNELAGDLPRVKNFNVAVKEVDNKILFLRKLQQGGSNHSFGIHVAQLAGMPNEVVFRSNEILKFLEKEKVGGDTREQLGNIPAQNFQLNLFEADPRVEQLMEKLRGLDINTISPVEALLKLNEMKDILKSQ